VSSGGVSLPVGKRGRTPLEPAAETASPPAASAVVRNPDDSITQPSVASSAFEATLGTNPPRPPTL